MKLHKYPRTRHLEGSRLQPGDEDLEQVAFSELRGRNLVVEEKLDGANAAVSFGEDGRPWLQSRGHFLTGGFRERHFAPFKQWAADHSAILFERLGTRYVLYGEWLYAKHTIFYDRLPAWLLEFDLLDRESGQWLSTPRRRALLDGTPVRSVPVLRQGPVDRLDQLTGLVGRSLCKSGGWRERLVETARAKQLDVDRVVAETDSSDDMEGLYLKLEEDGQVLGRYKWVRASFLTTVIDSGSHWLSRPIVPNQVAE
jgi:hypothetical protein